MAEHIERWYVVGGDPENPTELRIHPENPFESGKPAGSSLRIGSTAVSFRAPRSGSHRGEKMQYGRFSDEDRRIVRQMAAAPDLLAACQAAYDYIAADDYGDPEILNELATALRRVREGA